MASGSGVASQPARAAAPAAINLSLVSHTNVGKTTLARTLLRRDVGEVRDRAHVTELAEAHVLIDTPEGDALRLWDTPGLGDSAKLLKRLRASHNPIGWLLSQVWDRLTDRPFYSSQQAIRNARDESDVILYLVNAPEDPASAGYVGVEMQILGWIGKPVVLLLNQTGPPRAPDAEAAEEAAWREHLRAYSWVRAAIGLDAFARCWVQEDELLGVLADLVSEEKRAALARLRSAWRERNLEVFERSMQAISRQLAAAAVDAEPVPERSWKDKAGRWLSSLVTGRDRSDPEFDRAMAALAQRLDQSVRDGTDQLIRLHGLSGQAAQQVLARVAGQFDLSKPADVAKSGVIGGLVTGALGGLAADLAAGGLTFGAGALLGGILGALGGTGAAQAYNLARGTEAGKVGWSASFLTQRVTAALFRYLAVAHFGRGRGDWVEGEYPPHWRAVVEDAVAGRRTELETVWMQAREGVSREEVERRLLPIVEEFAQEVLHKLYPGIAVFSAPRPHTTPA